MLPISGAQKFRGGVRYANVLVTNHGQGQGTNRVMVLRQGRTDERAAQRHNTEGRHRSPAPTQTKVLTNEHQKTMCRQNPACSGHPPSPSGASRPVKQRPFTTLRLVLHDCLCKIASVVMRSCPLLSSYSFILISPSVGHARSTRLWTGEGRALDQRWHRNWRNHGQVPGDSAGGWMQLDIGEGLCSGLSYRLRCGFELLIHSHRAVI